MRYLKIIKRISNRDSQAVEKYLQEISKIDLIPPEEETILAKKIKAGDQEALHKLVRGNLRFAVSVAKQYEYQGLSLGDLINEGNIGLLKAATKFDETRKFKFISYAVWWIRQSILEALNEHPRVVRLPANKNGEYNSALRAYDSFEQQHERAPSSAELAEILEIEPSEVDTIFRINQYSQSLDAPLKDAEGVSLGDILPAPNQTDSIVCHSYFLDEIHRVLSKCKKRDVEILFLMCGIGVDDPIPLDDIATRYDITVNRARQIIDKMKLVLSKPSIQRRFLPYVD